MNKKIIIIGGGLTGLAAGCYARMNGFETEIYESHNRAGGLCTAWKRGEYTFDGCIHWLTGSGPGRGPGQAFYKFWNELGALKKRKIYDPDCFYRYMTKDGRLISFYSDADRLRQHWTETSPEDAKVIREFCSYIKKTAKMKMPMEKPFELFKFWDIVKIIITMLPYGKLFKQLTTQSIAEFASKFKDPGLRDALENIVFNKNVQLMAAVMTLSTLHSKSGGFPIGGSLEFAKAIESRYLSLGGKIHFRSPVEKILVENDMAVGIRLEGGQEIKGDYIISAADMHATLYKFLDGKYTEPIHNTLFNHTQTYNTCIQVSLGINMTFGEKEDCVGLHYPVKVPFSIGENPVTYFGFRTYSMDPTMAPQGKTSAVALYMTDDFDYWEKLHKDKESYRSEKSRILDMTLKNLECYYPGISDKVEVTDVSTPMTYMRYTQNWRGNFMSWVGTPGNHEELQRIGKMLPGLQNFYMAGMWVMPPGGVPTAAKTGRDAIQLICAKEKIRFQTTKDM
ncbi:MAG: NAD(P)/FAD-dependent oxidoreductase [Spirochaetales bacterium]|nr:NAD(P)/FAD-dependent oxidoreductase [Spirochaetales bacterium]